MKPLDACCLFHSERIGAVCYRLGLLPCACATALYLSGSSDGSAPLRRFVYDVGAPVFSVPVRRLCKRGPPNWTRRRAGCRAAMQPTDALSVPSHANSDCDCYGARHGAALTSAHHRRAQGMPTPTVSLLSACDVCVPLLQIEHCSDSCVLLLSACSARPAG